MRKIIIFCIGITLFLVGCGSYQDTNKTLFAVTTVVDIDEENKPIIYMEAFRSLYSQESADEKGERIILTGSGATMADALLDLNQMASYEVIATHNKAIIFTEKAARYGLDHFLDFFIREQDYLLRPNIMIYSGDINELLDIETGQEEFLGFYLEQLVKNEFSEAITYPEKLFEYINLSTIGDKTDVLILLSIQEDERPKIYIREGAVMKENKMVEKLSKDEIKVYCIFDEQHQVGYITIPHPKVKGQHVSLEVLKNKVKTDVIYDGNKENTVKLKKDISLRMSFEETQSKLDIRDSKIRQQLEEGVKKKVIEESEALYSKFKNQGIDIFDVEKEFRDNYPHEKKNDVFKSSQLDINVKVFIEGSPNTQNYEE